MKFEKLFGRLKAVVIGMIHVRALPGSPLAQMSVSQIIDEACTEASVYKHASIDGLIIENMHDVPYSLHPRAEVTSCMTAVSTAVRNICPQLPLGIQILSAANQEAVAVALASGLDFIRAEGFVFSQVSDEGLLLSAAAADLLRYRRQVGAQHVQIFTDIKKKHSSHALTADVSIAETARAAEFFLSDGVIVTGTSTGSEADPQELRDVCEAVNIPVLIGSGATIENIHRFLDANAIIIGSHFKVGGHWANAIDPVRVQKLMEKIQQLRE